MKTVFYTPLVLVLSVAACGDSARPAFLQRDGGAQVAVSTPGADTTRPQARPGDTPRPPPGARTAEAFDTTTAAQRAAAVQAAPTAGAVLGQTVASLGNPAEPGFWLRTGLVQTVTPGRVSAGSGAGVAVELRPSGNPAGGGSQLSLAAFRALNLSLTDLHRLEVSAQ